MGRSPSSSDGAMGAKRWSLRPWIAFVAGCVVGSTAAIVILPKGLADLASTHCPKVDSDLRAIESAVNEYAVANGGRFPTTLQQLVTPDQKGRTYLDCVRVPVDVWGRESIYELPGPGQPRPRILTLGRDGRPGGKGDDADIDNLSFR